MADRSYLDDKVGLAWRDELAGEIYMHLDAIDHIELLADREIGASRNRLRAFRELGRQVPLSLHGVGLGLCSTESVSGSRLRSIARLVHAIEPHHWSEHLAFVRSGPFEIGHLAAPPRTNSSVMATIANVAAAKSVVGSVPHLENVASLIDPPSCTLTEGEFARAIAQSSGAPLLLDLHNLYANAVNFGRDAFDLLHEFPFERVRTVHLSGGVEVADNAGGTHLLDDHLHDPPAVVFELLEELASKATSELTVIVERDGAYPEFERILSQLQRARHALARGRARWRETNPQGLAWEHANGMTEDGLQQLLAAILSDTVQAEAFVRDRRGFADKLGLKLDQHPGLLKIDRETILLAAQSYARKRCPARCIDRSAVKHHPDSEWTEVSSALPDPKD